MSQGTKQCQTQCLIFLRRRKWDCVKKELIAGPVFLVVCEPNAYSPNLVICCLFPGSWQFPSPASIVLPTDIYRLETSYKFHRCLNKCCTIPEISLSRGKLGVKVIGWITQASTFLNVSSTTPCALPSAPTLSLAPLTIPPTQISFYQPKVVATGQPIIPTGIDFFLWTVY